MLRLLILVSIFGMAAFTHGQVVINEVQSSNGITAEDEDGDNEDWIELYNTSSQPVNLEGYWLSDDYANPSRWVFPDVIIEPEATLLVWASGKNRTAAGLPLHTNFSISSMGEEILLSAPSGELLDEVPPKTIPTDVSWGRFPDGADAWVFFVEPTPGSGNAGESYQEVLNPPTFSTPGGFYGGEFELSLSHSDPTVTIIYTIDGSLPSLDAVGGITYQYKNQYRRPGDPDGELLTNQFESHVYSENIWVADRSPQPNKLAEISSTYSHIPNYFPSEPLYKGTVVRARAIKDGAAPSPVVTQSYFISENGENPFELPVISLSLQEDDFFDYEKGMYVAGWHFDQWRDENLDVRATGMSPANWHQRGPEWERPGHLEFYEPGRTQADLQQDIGIRLHGGQGRIHKHKSLRLYARNAYGESRFNHQFFPDISDNQFNRLILRNSGNDYNRTLFRDAMIQSLAINMRVDTQAYRPSVVFINGEYWGIHNIRERYDRHYLARNYGVDPDNIDYLSNLGDVNEGDAVHYEETLDFLENNSLAVDANYEYFKTRVDTDNFMDYKILNIFADNTDWPASNIDYWRLRTDEYQPNAQEGHDGRWRWLVYDTDFGFGVNEGAIRASNDTMRHATVRLRSRLVLRSLLENDSFRNDFINRFSDLLNANFSSDYVVAVINRMKAVIEPEMGSHIQRWSGPDSIAHWHDNVNVLVDFAKARPAYQREHLRNHFGLGNDYLLTLDVAAGQGTVRVNSLTINDNTPGVVGAAYPWSGRYFDGVAIELEALPAPGYEFSHWTGLPEGTPALTTLESAEDLQVTAHFVAADKPFLHFWLFGNDLANNTPLEAIEATISFGGTGRIVFQSALADYPFHNGHEQWRSASMERRNRPTPINYLMSEPFDESGMRGLQIRQPFVGDAGENTLIFELPTPDQSDVVFSFAAIDEGAAEGLVIDYSVNKDFPEWTTTGLTETLLPLSNEFQLYQVDFSGIAAVNNNPHFRVRIRFVGAEMTMDRGDRVTFNNFSVQSVPGGVGDDDDEDRPDDPDRPDAPANNRFAQAQTISGLSGIVVGTTESAGLEAGEPDHSQASGATFEHSVWWTWQAEETDRMTFSADSGSAIVVYVGESLETLTAVASQYTGSNEVMFLAQAGQTYKLAGSNLGGVQGDIALTWEQSAPAAPPQVFNADQGGAAIICEMADCVMAGNSLNVNAADAALLVTLPNGEWDIPHSHHLQQLDDLGQALWRTEFSTGLPGVQSRIIADTQGLPVVVSQLILEDDQHYQVEAYPDGLARHRMVSAKGELIRMNLALPGSRTELHNDGRLTVTAPLPDQDLRVLLEVSREGRLVARYQRRIGARWDNYGDLLTRTRFPEGATVVVTRENGTVRIQVDTQIDNDLHF